MRTLSIRQPWAWAILNLGKDIENRVWQRDFKGTIYIHTGKKVDKLAIEYLWHRGYPETPTEFKTGGIVGTVEIIDCVTKSDSDWFEGPYGFVLQNAVKLPFTPLKGRLGFFDTVL